MEGVQEATTLYSDAKGGGGSVWDAPPPALARCLIENGHNVSTLRLLNTNWCKEVDREVKHAVLRLNGVFRAGIEERVMWLFMKFPGIDTLVCRKAESLVPIIEFFREKLVDLVVDRCGFRDWELLPLLSKLEALEVKDKLSKGLNLGHLSKMKRLRKVVFESTEEVGVNMDAVSALTGLQMLGFRNCNMQTAGFVEPLTNLVDLRFNEEGHTRMETDNFGAISALTKLTRLDLPFTNFGDCDAACLSGLVHLRALNLDFTDISDVGFSNVSHLIDLDSLNVYCSNVTEDGYDPITCLTGLTYLQMGNYKMSFKVGSFLIHLTRLKELTVFGFVQNDALCSIATLDSLVYLSLDVSYVTNDAFSVLGMLSCLQRVKLFNRTREDGVILSEWGIIPQMRKLVLDGDGWMDESLVRLSSMGNMQDLRLQSRCVTDAGLHHLAKLHNLKNLQCFCARVSEDCKGALQEALPFCNIAGRFGKRNLGS